MRIGTAGVFYAIAVALALLPPATSGEPPQDLTVSFDSERVKLTVISDTLEVHGTYYLVCRRSGASVSLFYPFPCDSLLGGARMVSLSASVGGAPPTPVA